MYDKMYVKKKQSKNVKKNRVWGAKTITKYENLLFMKRVSDLWKESQSSSWGAWKEKLRNGSIQEKSRDVFISIVVIQGRPRYEKK